MADGPPFVIAERVDDVLWLTLNRPERLNAVHLAMRDELWTQLCLLRDDASMRAAVFLGAGERAFSAGADLTDFGTAPSVIEARSARTERDVWGVMAALSVPLIAAVHGFAYGAGCELAMYCDLRIAADDARFAIPEVRLGYIPSAGGTQLIARHVPLGDAMRMATSGEPIDAHEAYRLGLVHAVVPRGELETTARAWAARLAALPQSALRATKRAIVDGLDMPLHEGIALERRLAAGVAGAGAGR